MKKTRRLSGARDLRSVALPLYVAAFMLVAIPVVEVDAQLGFAGDPTSLQWRTSAVGLLSSALLTPAFGFVIAVVTAHAFEHTMTHRVLSVLSGLLSVLLAAVIALFVLDAFQLRSTMNPKAGHAFTLAMVKAVLDFSIVSIALLIVCIGGLRAGRKAKVFRVMRVESADVSMVVHR
jgi:uncharacterized membrane protein YsdA (DUF1294 family)